MRYPKFKVLQIYKKKEKVDCKVYQIFLNHIFKNQILTNSP